ncbi:MAG: periplasmic binding protein/LacI transcriptional regulator [Caloramator sp.]|jgi:ribose transport system substrate-binding protein|uniref:substrate-binding domain-containing protein n=1 Tax=Caloramator sp. TaxID=1871330 RepID=UPI001DF5ADB8|nr:substrate-binding domain-containing protein [Caloramator sp.]MBZ4662955.1 periplasmic binding protein/LacI transcriptional regulator [Caloramator sp.]
MLKKFVDFINRQAILILLTVNLLASLILLYAKNGGEQPVFAKPQYHFYFITQNSIDPFWNEVIMGANKAAKDNNVVIEFCSPRFNDPKEQLKYLDIAILSKVDGIITHVPIAEDFTSLIDKAYFKGIPVITFENDDNKSKRYSFVGINSFEVGKKAAELMIKATGGRANIAIITSNDLNQDLVENNLKMNGFFSAIKDYPEMKVVKTYTSKMGILSAEEITQKIIDSQEKINAIFTVSSADTLGAAQLIVDRNKVGEITLVGYGSSEEIIRYIDKEIIYGTISSDPFQMGYESVKALIDIKSSKNVPYYINTELKVLTKETIEEFKKKSNEKEKLLKWESFYE